MNITQTLTNPDHLRSLSRVERQLGTTILQTNLGLLPTESVLIVTDPTMVMKEAAVWFEAAKKLALKVTLLVLEGMTASGQEPPAKVRQLCAEADVVIFQTRYSLTHTQASQATRIAGGRVASLPHVDYDMMLRTLPIPYQPIRELGIALKTKLEAGQTLRIVGDNGTNLTCAIRRDFVVNDSGFISSGEVGNLPAGEVFFAPLPFSTQGTWVIDGSLADDTLTQPVTLTIADGRVVAIAGNEVADRLRQKLTALGERAFEVAEVGLGTNPSADAKGWVIEAEKAYGTAHLAVGNNASMGGDNTTPLHLDGVTLKPTVTIDDELVIEEGICQFLHHKT